MKKEREGREGGRKGEGEGTCSLEGSIAVWNPRYTPSHNESVQVVRG